MSTGKKKTTKIIVTALVSSVAIGAGVWIVRNRAAGPGADANHSPAPAASHRPSPAPSALPRPSPVASAPATASAPASPSPSPVPPASQPALSAADAKRAFDEGLALLGQGQPVPARVALTQALFSGGLSTADEARAVKELTDLADRVFFSRQFVEGDPYVLPPYTVNPGDMLEGPKGIEMSLGLHVPARLLLRINGLARGADLRAGQRIKLLRGPFHARVYKGRFLMDLYLQRDDLEAVFVRRVSVGLGRNGSTPVGAWRVQLGQKMERPPYNATEGSDLPIGTKVLYGQPGYPFGVKGLWIGLEGIDLQTQTITDFGIHSTNDANSIGKANSLGCVRMADDDIDLVFSLLYDVHSRVDVLP